MTETPMIDAEAQAFAEATLLDLLRANAGDFHLSVERRGDRFEVTLSADDGSQIHTHGASFAEAWLAGHRARPVLKVIEGGK